MSDPRQLPPGITDSSYKPLPGRIGNLTDAQYNTLVKFKQELTDEGAFVPGRMDDAYVLRCVSRACGARGWVLTASFT